MTDFDVCTLGAATLDPRTNACVVQAANELGDGDELEPFGEVAFYGALGVTAMPAAADDAGSADAVIARGIGGADGAVIASRDVRTADVVAALKPGETCVHATGKGFDARTFYKRQMIANVIGDDFVMMMDRENKKFIISCFGMVFEMSGDKGITLTDGSGGVNVKGGTVAVFGNVVLGGLTPNPAQPVLGGPGGTGGACTAFPSTRVFLGAG